MKIIYFTFILSIILNPLLGYSQVREALPEAEEVVSEATKKDNGLKKKIYSDFWKHGSLMLSKEDADAINLAVIGKVSDDYLKAKTLKAAPETATTNLNFHSEVVNDGASKKIFEFPTFSLKSILFFSTNNWSLWLNKTKISQNDYSATLPYDIELVKISPSKAFFIWKNSYIKIMSQQLKDSFIKADDGKYYSSDKKFIFDEFNDNISFVLKPNQTFIPQIMEIVEGDGKKELAAFKLAEDNKNKDGIKNKTDPTISSNKSEGSFGAIFNNKLDFINK